MRTASRLDATASGADRDDVLAKLQTDHRRVEALFARASMEPEPHRGELVTRIMAELTAHADLEETAVYPTIAGALSGAPWLVDRAEDEHEEMRRLMAAVEDATDEVSLLAALRALELVVRQHVAVEEGEIFPAFRQLASDADLQSLANADDTNASPKEGPST